MLLLNLLAWFIIFIVLGLFTTLLGTSVAMGIGLFSSSFFVYNNWVLILRILAGISFGFAAIYCFPRALRHARQEEREKYLQSEHGTLIGIPLPTKPNIIHRVISWFRGE